MAETENLIEQERALIMMNPSNGKFYLIGFHNDREDNPEKGKKQEISKFSI